MTEMLKSVDQDIEYITNKISESEIQNKEQKREQYINESYEKFPD